MATPNIPLRCTLCPKQPTFSDVSHLLTHISSKGHLSCYFRQKVRASGDPETRATVDDFDRWYSDWNIDSLMADRLNLKDKKNRVKNATRRGTPARASPANSLGRVAQHGARSAHLSRANSQQLSPYDPQYDNTHIKREASQVPWTPARDQNPYGQAYNLRTSTTTRQLNYADSPYDSDNSGFSSYPDPSHGHGLGDQYENSSFNSGSRGTPNIQQQDDSDDDDLPIAEDTEWDHRRNTAKLKGTIWPGMAIFDSATPEQRRRRNQKKSQTVLTQLETNSCNVENLEKVWHANGDLKKQKEISGLPSSSSPALPSPSTIPIRNGGLTMSDFHRQAYTNTPASSRVMLSGRHNSYRHGSSGKSKRDFEAYHDDDDTPSQASFSQPVNISYLTRGMNTYHDTDDINARPVRRRMRDDGHLDNLPYENMSEARRSEVQEKRLQDHGRNMMASHTNILKQAAEKMLPPNYSHGQGNYGQQSGDATQRKNNMQETGNIVSGRAKSQEEYLRGVGGQFLDDYAHPAMFSGNVTPIDYRGHGNHARRSAGSINIEDIVNGYPSNQTVFVPNGAYPGMPNQAFAYDQQPSNAYAIPPGFDMNQILQLTAQSQHGINSAWSFGENGAVQNSEDPKTHTTSDRQGAAGTEPTDIFDTTPKNKATQSDNIQGPVELDEKPRVIASTPAAATDDGRTVTAPASSPAL